MIRIFHRSTTKDGRPISFAGLITVFAKQEKMNTLLDALITHDPELARLYSRAQLQALLEEWLMRIRSHGSHEMQFGE